MIGFDQACALLEAAAIPLGPERVALSGAAGRRLAAPVVARLDSPRFDVSSMDGYAVRETDLTSGLTTLKVLGESFPGAGFKGALGCGECVRIFTGAAAPPGADRIIIQEVARREGEVVHIRTSLSENRYLRPQGSDFRAGETMLEAGRRLEPQALVAAAAADVAELEVFRRPRVVALSTGDELAEPGTAAADPQAIPDSVSFGVAALAQQWGGEVIGRERLGDYLPALERAAAEALERADVVVVTGGASVGERDFARAMFAPAGLELIFSRVAIKPGKPVWLGRAGGRLVLGLPGNPTSALVTARLFLAPLLAGLGGWAPAAALAWQEAVSCRRVPGVGDRETFLRGAWVGAMVKPHLEQDSGAQKALADAEVLIRRRAHAPAEGPGASLEVLDF